MATATPAAVITETYKSEKEMRRGIEQMMARGYVVQSTNITEHRGAGMTGCGCLTFGLFTLFLPKKKHWHVTFVVAPPPMPAAPTGF